LHAVVVGHVPVEEHVLVTVACRFAIDNFGVIQLNVATVPAATFPATSAGMNVIPVVLTPLAAAAAADATVQTEHMYYNVCSRLSVTHR
jgi:hypothetical protein